MKTPSSTVVPVLSLSEWAIRTLRRSKLRALGTQESSHPETKRRFRRLSETSERRDLRCAMAVDIGPKWCALNSGITWLVVSSHKWAIRSLSLSHNLPVLKPMPYKAVRRC